MCMFGCSTANPDQQQILEFEDVQEGRPIKRYSDSQYMSFYTNNLKNSTIKSPLDQKSPVSHFGDRVKQLQNSQYMHVIVNESNEAPGLNTYYGVGNVAQFGASLPSGFTDPRIEVAYGGIFSDDDEL